MTSDSDFTKLAYRIKESGKELIGMGEQKTNAYNRKILILPIIAASWRIYEAYFGEILSPSINIAICFSFIADF